MLGTAAGEAAVAALRGHRPRRVPGAASSRPPVEINDELDPPHARADHEGQPPGVLDAGWSPRRRSARTSPPGPSRPAVADQPSAVIARPALAADRGAGRVSSPVGQRGSRSMTAEHRDRRRTAPAPRPARAIAAVDRSLSMEIDTRLLGMIAAPRRHLDRVQLPVRTAVPHGPQPVEPVGPVGVGRHHGHGHGPDHRVPEHRPVDRVDRSGSSGMFMALLQAEWMPNVSASA